jgi:hypothetical protein
MYCTAAGVSIGLMMLIYGLLIAGTLSVFPVVPSIGLVAAMVIFYVFLCWLIYRLSRTVPAGEGYGQVKGLFGNQWMQAIFQESR